MQIIFANSVFLSMLSACTDSFHMCLFVQDHGLEAGLDIQLIPQCASALPEDPKTQAPQPVYLEMPIVNTNRYS